MHRLSMMESVGWLSASAPLPKHASAPPPFIKYLVLRSLITYVTYSITHICTMPQMVIIAFLYRHRSPKSHRPTANQSSPSPVTPTTTHRPTQLNPNVAYHSPSSIAQHRQQSLRVSFL
jgi:hypothetical protein